MRRIRSILQTRMSSIQQAIPEITVVIESGTVNSQTKTPGLATLRKNMPSVLNIPNSSMTLSGFGNLPNGVEITSNNNRFTITAIPRILMTPSAQIPQFEPEADVRITRHVNAATTLWGAVIDPNALQLPSVVTPIPMHQWGLAPQAPYSGGVTISGGPQASVVTNPIFAYTVSNVYGLVGINAVGRNWGVTGTASANYAGAFQFQTLDQLGSFLENTVQNNLGQKLWFPATQSGVVPTSWGWTNNTGDILQTPDNFKQLQLFSPLTWNASNSGTNNYIGYTAGSYTAWDPALGLDWNADNYGFGAMSKFIMNSLYYACPDMGQNPFAMGGPILDFNRFNAVTFLNKPNTFILPTGSDNNLWLPCQTAFYTNANINSFVPFWNNLGVPQQNYVESQIQNSIHKAAMEPSHFMAVMTQNLCKVQPNYNFLTNNVDNSNGGNANTNTVFCYEPCSAARVAASLNMNMCLIPTKIGCPYASAADNPLDQYLYNSGFRADLANLVGHFNPGGLGPGTNPFNYYTDLQSRYCPTLYGYVENVDGVTSWQNSGAFSLACTYAIYYFVTYFIRQRN